MRRILGIAGLMMCVCLGARAQGLAASQDGGAQAAALPVLHVYADLLQVPVLVLDREHELRRRPAAGENFALSIGSGPWFRAAHVRQEDDDPITLTVLLDMSGWTGDVMPQVGQAVAALGMGSLHAQDRVMVYALDCRLATAGGEAAPDAAKLTDAVELLTSSAGERRAHGGRECKRRDGLRDTLVALIDGLSAQPGRRAILAVTDGEDERSAHSWKDVALLAQSRSVAVFGATYKPYAAGQQQSRRAIGEGWEFGFPGLCSASGGYDRVSSRPALTDAVKWAVEAMRARYILEFPRPANAAAGRYQMEVRLDGSPEDQLLMAGVTFPLQSKAVLDDPATVKDETTGRPTMGSRKSLE